MGRKEINYRLRDWVFSRQRYWGEPFPVAFDKEGNTVTLPLEDLPLSCQRCITLNQVAQVNRH